MLGKVYGTNNAVKELLAENPKALKGMHKLGLDFAKPFICVKADGNFTNNTIRKTVEHYSSGVGSYQMRIYLLIRANETWENGLYVVKLVDNGWESDSLKKVSRNCGLNTYWKKALINEKRKENPNYYIIAQHKAFSLPEKKPAEIDFNERIIVTKQQDYSNGEICYIDFVMRDNRRIGGEVRPLQTLENNREYNEINDLVDKSGYRRDIKYYELMGRVRQFRTEKKRAEAQALDCTEYIENASREISTIRISLADFLRNTDNPDWTKINELTHKIMEINNRLKDIKEYNFWTLTDKNNFIIRTTMLLENCKEIAKGVCVNYDLI